MAASQPSALIDGADLSEWVPLDSGVFGPDVSLCHHKHHGQLLVKTVCTEHQHSESKRRCLLREVEPLLKLNHSRIVRVLGVVLKGGPPSLVMQFFPKGHLLAVLNEVTVPISIKGRIVLDLLEGMVYLTNNGIVHKDLKPQNILVDEDFHIKIADLGLASCRSWSKLTMEESRRQSRGGVCRGDALVYLAPEHLLSINKPFTQKSDVYSFAIILWVILTNQEPSRDQDDQTAAAARRPEEGRIPRSTPLEMVTLMKKCWHQDPAQRPPFSESYNYFQCFYRDQLEKNVEKDLKSLTGRSKSPALTAEMNALSLGEPRWQTDGLSGSFGASSVGSPRIQEGLWLESLQTDALPAGRSHAPFGSFINSPELSVPPGQSLPHAVQRQASSGPQPREREAPAAPHPNVTMRERKSDGVGRPKACACCSLHPPNQRIRSWPVFPEPEAQCSGTGAESSSGLHRQSSVGVFIQNATGVQFGDYNHLTVVIRDDSEDCFQPSSSDMSPYEELLQKYEDRAVKKEQVDLLAKNIGQNWKCCARKLRLTDVELETISYNCAMEGLDEMVHQMLQKWQMKTGTVGCTVGELCRALRDCVSVDILCQLLRMCQDATTP